MEAVSLSTTSRGKAGAQCVSGVWHDAAAAKKQGMAFPSGMHGTFPRQWQLTIRCRVRITRCAWNFVSVSFCFRLMGLIRESIGAWLMSSYCTIDCPGTTIDKTCLQYANVGNGHGKSWTSLQQGTAKSERLLREIHRLFLYWWWRSGSFNDRKTSKHIRPWIRRLNMGTIETCCPSTWMSFSEGNIKWNEVMFAVSSVVFD